MAAALLLCIYLTSSAGAFTSPSRAACRTRTSNQRRYESIENVRTVRLQSTVGDIADIEEITSFASENGVTLSFTTFGPGAYFTCSFVLNNFSAKRPNLIQKTKQRTTKNRLQRRSCYEK